MLVAAVLSTIKALPMSTRLDAHTAVLRWRWHQRQLQQSSPRQQCISDHGGPKVLLLTQADRVSQSQIFPFHFYRTRMIKELGLSFRECLVNSALQDERILPEAADLVILQLWMDAGPALIDAVFSLIRRHYGAAPIVFLDPLSPTDLRMAERLGDRVDLYVKKHLLKDRGAYQTATRGDTNLTDWYGRHFSHELPPTRFVAPKGFFDKLVAGPTFYTAAHLLPGFFLNTNPPPSKARPIDLHARLGGTNVANSWYGDMRRAASAAALNIGDLIVTPQTAVPRRRFLQELAKSKMAWSPFGYGEVCWRDFEAIHQGAVLLKQNMSHLAADPDIFIENETYVPVAWDFSDLAEQTKRLAHDERMLTRLRANAYGVVNDYAANARFVTEFVQPLIAKCTQTSNKKSPSLH